MKNISNAERSITIMELKFFGIGSGFSDEHTSAYFTIKNKMVIIDCPITAFQKLKHMDLLKYKSFYIFITHTHGDHVGGLGLFIQYAFFVLKRPVTIVAPSSELASDITKLLEIEGINYAEGYNLVIANDLQKEWFGGCIQTEHAPELKGKCFGYHFIIDGINIIYTGDTSTLEPFVPYLTDEGILYVDTSVYYGKVHLKLEDVLNDLIEFTKRGIKVYLMHLDNVPVAEIMVADIPGIEVVSVD